MHAPHLDPPQSVPVSSPLFATSAHPKQVFVFCKQYGLTLSVQFISSRHSTHIPFPSQIPVEHGVCCGAFVSIGVSPMHSWFTQGSPSSTGVSIGSGSTCVPPFPS